MALVVQPLAVVDVAVGVRELTNARCALRHPITDISEWVRAKAELDSCCHSTSRCLVNQHAVGKENGLCRLTCRHLGTPIRPTGDMFVV